MCLEFSQADFRAVGRSRGFEAETIASRELMQHLFLSEHGVASALALLTPVEIAALHLLHCLRDAVDLEFFKRVYPDAVSANLYASYNERFKALFQRVRAQFVQRGLLLFGTLPDSFQRGPTILERRRFRFPEAFGALLPAPFQVRQLDPAITGRHRAEVLRDKVAELLQCGSAAAGEPSGGKAGRWRLENGELHLGSDSARFRVKQLETWQRSQFERAAGFTDKAQPEALRPVPLLLYALSRLRDGEWLAANELVPLWKVALPKAKAPEPQTACEAGYDWGCVEKIEVDGGPLYRLPRSFDSQAGTPAEDFLQTENPQEVRIRLDRTPVAALERLGEIARLELANGELRAVPNLLKLSHAPVETLADPMIGWLREHHPAFRSTMERIEQRRGKLIVHENLLVARISDLALKVMVEKRFGAPGQLVALSKQFVAFPSGMLPEIRSWMKKSGHVIKTIQSEEAVSADPGGREDG